MLSLTEGCHKVNEIRCPTRHKEKSRVPRVKKPWILDFWLNKKKRKFSPLFEHTKPLSQKHARKTTTYVPNLVNVSWVLPSHKLKQEVKGTFEVRHAWRRLIGLNLVAARVPRVAMLQRDNNYHSKYWVFPRVRRRPCDEPSKFYFFKEGRDQLPRRGRFQGQRHRIKCLVHGVTIKQVMTSRCATS